MGFHTMQAKGRDQHTLVNQWNVKWVELKLPKNIGIVNTIGSNNRL